MQKPKPGEDPLYDLRYQYCRLMREIKMRQASITTTLRGDNPFPAFIAFEHCYLQLRMMCECIALACLSVHGDIPATHTKKLTKAYAADDILKALEELHPSFYPEPAKINPVTLMSEAGDQLHPDVDIYAAKPLRIRDYMRKPDLLTLYWECGGILHRGTMRKMRDGTTDDWERVQMHSVKLIRLLNQHQIQLSNPDEKFGVTMSSAAHEGEVHAVILNAAVTRELGIPDPVKPTA